MTPNETKRRMAVMAKHGEPLWQIESRSGCAGPWTISADPKWLIGGVVYRAVRVERSASKRVPLPWSTIRCGMQLRLKRGSGHEVLLAIHIKSDSILAGEIWFLHEAFMQMEYLDGDTWKPLWTEEPGEERIVEIVSEEEG